MEAHESPTPLYGHDGLSTNLSLSNINPSILSNDVERRLPSGEKVDFGNSKKTKKRHHAKKATKSKDSEAKNKDRNWSPEELKCSDTEVKGRHSQKTAKKATDKTTGTSGKDSSKGKKKQTELMLPNGESPSFYNDDNRSKKKGTRILDPVLPNGQRPNFNGDSGKSKKLNKGPVKAAQVAEESYAGSSFHSSPAALNLPKPSFKASPKLSPVPALVSSQSHVLQNNVHQMAPPNGAINNVPMVPGSIGNRASYVPHGVQAPPFGNLSTYPYPMNAGFAGQPVYGYPPFVEQFPPYGGFNHTPNSQQSLTSIGNQGGQKISFNELLGVTKN